MINEIFNIINNSEEETHDSYLKNLTKYKSIIDKSPNKFLKFHLQDSIKKERYELSKYIKDLALSRGVKIKL